MRYAGYSLEKKESRFLQIVLLLLFFLSGATALIYQVIWSRLLTTIFGSTVYAVSVVLASFMCGLSIGSYFLGKQADQWSNPLLLYGLCEIGIAVTAVGSFFLIRVANSVFSPIYDIPGAFALRAILRFAIVFIIIIVPTTLIGGTLPILSKTILSKLQNISKNLSSLYAINTFGAVCGSFAVGFFLIKWLGLLNTVCLAASVNLQIGIIAWLISYSTSRRPSSRPKKLSNEKKPPSKTRLQQNILFLFALSGFISFGYEIFWTRSLTIILGNSTYAFTMMLIAFLSGIALGGYLIRFLSDRIRYPIRLFAIIQAGIGLSASVVVPLLINFIYSSSTQYFFSQKQFTGPLVAFFQFGAAFVVMFIPTTLIGTTLPLVSKIYIKDPRKIGGGVGKVSAVNTLGNILGAIIPAFFILPAIGINKGILLLACLNIAIFIYIITFLRNKRIPLQIAGVSIYLAMIVFILFLPIRFHFPSDTQSPSDKVLFYKEGISATTKVYQKTDRDEKHMSVDGIYIGGSGNTEVKEYLLAHLPKLLLSVYTTELTIGLGSGILAGESSLHQSLDAIVCLEISPSVVEGARYFQEENHGIFDDPRIRIVVADGINYLRKSKQVYDIISSDAKSKPTSRGNGLFFSQDYYRLIKSNLSPEGIFIQWIPLNLPTNAYSMAIETFLSVFPYASLWLFPDTDSFIIGSSSEMEMDFAYIKQMLSDSSVSTASLRRYGINSPESLIANYIASEDNLRLAILKGNINTFNNPYMEFYSFKEYAMSTSAMISDNLDLLIAIRNDNLNDVVLNNATKADFIRLSKSYMAKELYLKAIKNAYSLSTDYESIETLLDDAVNVAPWDDYLGFTVQRYHLIRGKRCIQNKNFSEAQDYLKKAMEIYPNNYEPYYLYGIVLSENNETDKAIGELLKAAEIAPERTGIYRSLFYLYLMQGDMQNAVAQLNTILSVDPNNVFSLKNLGLYYGEKELDYGTAVQFLDKAHQLEPQDGEIVASLIWHLYLKGDIEKSVKLIKESGRYYKEDPSYKKQRRYILNITKQGNP